jgi:hypothetical protein
MALFGRDYDRDFGNRNRGFFGNRNDAGFGNRYDSGWRSTNRGGMGRSNYDTGYAGSRGWREGWAYDGSYAGERGYGREYKSRWQTEQGDPFGDRQSRTPMRVINEDARDAYDHGYFGGRGGYDRGFGNRTQYGRDYSSNPVGYEPYGGSNTWGREGTSSRGRGRNMGYGRGYDRDWF